MKRIAVLKPEVRSQKSEARCLISVFCILSSALCLLSSECNAATEESVKSNVMSFAKKKASSEIVEPVATAQAVEAVPAAAPVFMPPASITPSSMPAKAVAKHTAVVASPVAAPAAAPSASISEAQSKLQAIKTQEQWIAKLTKQLEGEKNQLKEMREGYAQAFGKEPK